MFRFAYANQNNAAASAMCAEAASSCTSQSSRFNCIALGAIIMASIIISRLIGPAFLYDKFVHYLIKGDLKR